MNKDCFANINYFWANMLVEELVRSGVKTFVISPGSRSALLALAAEQNPLAETVVHFDERGSGFYALGFCSVKGESAALICTSGTAVANYLPAVIEASKKKLPLIVISGDRPFELQKSGAPQTIEQQDIFSSFTRYFLELPLPSESISPQSILTSIDQSLYISRFPMAGPVHINCPFAEPLSSEEREWDYNLYIKGIEKWMKTEKPYTDYCSPEMQASDIACEKTAAIVKMSRCGIILAGKLRNDEEQKAILEFAELTGWPVFPDIVSGLRGKEHPNIINMFDLALLSKKLCGALKPDTVIQCGGRMTSKRLMQYVKETAPENYIMVLKHHLKNDPDHNVSIRVQSDAGSFFKKTGKFLTDNGFIKKRSYIIPALLKASSVCSRALLSRERESGLSEVLLPCVIQKHLPEDFTLFLSNSMPVRIFDMYSVENSRILFKPGANRGASGIDGVTAAAAGFSAAFKRRTLLVTGDTAMLHDLNSLALLKESQVTILVINNRGGEIFSFLPVKKSTEREAFKRLFTNSHKYTFESAAAMFGLDYAKPRNMEELAEVIADPKPGMIEVSINRHKSVEEHEALHREISSLLDREF